METCGSPPTGPDALALCGLGWSVVPVHALVGGRCTCGRPDCPSPGKHPRIRWEGAQRQAATADQVAGWWRRWPASNVGVVTGRVSGVVVLDVDPRNGGDETLAALEATHGPLPPTVRSHTGGGGRHFWFAHPAETVPSRPLAPGVDLKAEGGLVVTPPSTHASGGRYTWAPGAAPWGCDLAAPPAWLLQMAWAIPEPLPRPGRVREPATQADRATFERLWETVGVAVGPGDHMVRCPFHPDHHPSLHVDTERCLWFCFGCRRGGGIGALRRAVEEAGGATPSRFWR